MGSTTHFITSSPIQIFLFYLLSIRELNNFFNTCLKTNNVRVLYILLAIADKSTITSIGMNQLNCVALLPVLGFIEHSKSSCS